MNSISIFRASMALMLLFTGLLKIVYFKYTRSTIQSINVFPLVIGKFMGYILPFFEIVMAIVLWCTRNNITYLLTFAYLFFFMAMNIRFLHHDVKCCCYGKLIPSMLGAGGFFHYTYWVVVIIMDIALGAPHSSGLLPLDALVVVLSIINSLAIRRLIEVAYER